MKVAEVIRDAIILAKDEGMSQQEFLQLLGEVQSDSKSWAAMPDEEWREVIITENHGNNIIK